MINNEQYAAIVKELKATQRPTRVVCSTSNGHVTYGTDPDSALRDHGAWAEAVLIRNDGWTLGFKLADRDAARALWAGSWIAEVSLAPFAVEVVHGGLAPNWNKV